MIFLFQVLFIVFSFLAINLIYGKKKDGLLGTRGLFFWVLFWLAADVAVLWPSSTTIIANHLGIGRGTDLVLYLSFVLNFYLLFKLHVKVESVGRDITKVVRRETLEKVSSQDGLR
jgi:hypothetical protein